MAELTPLFQCFPGKSTDIRNSLRTMEDKVTKNGEQLGLAHLQQVCQDLDADADCQSRQESSAAADSNKQQQKQQAGPPEGGGKPNPGRYPARDRRPPNRYGYEQGDFQMYAGAPLPPPDRAATLRGQRLRLWLRQLPRPW